MIPARRFGPPSEVTRSLLIGAGFGLLGLILVPLAAVRPSLTMVPGDRTDSRLNNYVLEHGFLWLSGQAPGFWDAPFFFPAKHALAYSINHLGSMPFYACFRALGSDRETAFQLWILAGFALNYAVCFACLRRFGFSPFAAALGSYVFAFGLPIVAHVANGHSQVLWRYCVPVALLAAWRLADGQRFAYAALLAAAVTLQAYTDIYCGFFLGLVLCFFLPAAFLFAPKSPGSPPRLAAARRLACQLGGAALLTAVLLLPLAFAYSSVFAASAGHLPVFIADLLPTPFSPVWVYHLSRCWGWLTPRMMAAAGTTVYNENCNFVGLVPCLATIAAMVWIRRERWQLAGTAAVTGILLLAFCTKFGGSSPYFSVLALPGVSAIRAVGRVIVVVLALVAIATAAWVEDALAAAPRKRVVLMMILGLLVPLDQLCRQIPGFDKNRLRERVARVVQTVQRESPAPRPFACLAPTPDSARQITMHLDAMLAAQELGVATVNGYGAVSPNAFPGLAFNDAAAVERWLDLNGVRQEVLLLGPRPEAPQSPWCQPGPPHERPAA